MADPTPAQLVDAHAAARARLSGAAVRYAGDQAGRFAGWYDTAAITAFAEKVAAHTQASQRQTAAVTDSYLLRVLRLLLGRQVRSAGPVDVSQGLRTGVTPAGVYGRTADVFRYQRSLGKSELEALRLAVERAEVMAEMDVTLAFRAQVQSTLTTVAQSQGFEPPAPRLASDIGDIDTPAKLPADAGPVLGYRRVIHPELSKGGTCGLCAAASTRIYGYADLLPIHSACRCTVLVVIEGHDPGDQINLDDLSRIYKDAGGTTDGRKLKAVRYQLTQHGELGPVISPAGQAVRTAADVARDRAIAS